MEIPPSPLNIVRTPTSEYWKVSDEKTLYGNILPGAFIDVDDVRENALARMKLLDINNPVPVILDITQMKDITPEARKESSMSVLGMAALAMIVDSGLSRSIGNFAIMTYRPVIPIRLFTSIEDAKEWIKEIQE